MTVAQGKAERQRVSDVRRQDRENERFRKTMLLIFKQALSKIRGKSTKVPHVFGTRTARKKSIRGRAERATRGAGGGKTEALILKINSGGRAGDGYAERAPRAEFIDSNMLCTTARERKVEWEIDCARHPRVNPSNLFIHVSLSRPEGQDLSPEEWKKTVRKFLKNIGAEGAQYVATRHSNTGNDHIHIIFSRSLPSGKLLSMSNNRWVWRAALRKTEIDLGLTVTERPVDAERAPTPTSDRMVNAQRRAARLKKQDCFIDPKEIGQVLSRSTTPAQFASGLQAAGINVKQAEKNGNVTGILFQREGVEAWLSGSSISREFSLPRLQARIESNRISLQKQEQEVINQQRRRNDQQRTARTQQRSNFERDL